LIILQIVLTKKAWKTNDNNISFNTISLNLTTVLKFDSVSIVLLELSIAQLRPSMNIGKCWNCVSGKSCRLHILPTGVDDEPLGQIELAETMG
jgi:hypothetical protein